MKRIIGLLFALFVVGMNSFAESKMNEDYEALSQTCTYSLKYTSVEVYTEVLVGGYGQSFVYATVLVNCKQEQDSYVTVHVYVSGRHVGSGVVVIPAGSTSSPQTKIDVDMNGVSGRATLKLG